MVTADKDNLDVGEVMITLNRLRSPNKKWIQSNEKKLNHVFQFYQDSKLQPPTLREHDFLENTCFVFTNSEICNAIFCWGGSEHYSIYQTDTMWHVPLIIQISLAF